MKSEEAGGRFDGDKCLLLASLHYPFKVFVNGRAFYVAKFISGRKKKMKVLICATPPQ